MERILILFVCVSYLLIFVQVTMFHYRQNFRHWSMWLPVIGTPVLAVLCLGYVCAYADWYSTLLGWAFVIAIIEGLIGTFMHIRGVGQRVDGFKIRNFLVGPPAVLPFLVSAIGLLGLIALYWRS